VAAASAGWAVVDDPERIQVQALAMFIVVFWSRKIHLKVVTQLTAICRGDEPCTKFTAVFINILGVRVTLNSLLLISIERVLAPMNVSFGHDSSRTSPLKSPNRLQCEAVIQQSS
jgi:hypothetical protein